MGDFVPRRRLVSKMCKHVREENLRSVSDKCKSPEALGKVPSSLGNNPQCGWSTKGGGQKSTVEVEGRWESREGPGNKQPWGKHDLQPKSLEKPVEVNGHWL